MNEPHNKNTSFETSALANCSGPKGGGLISDACPSAEHSGTGVFKAANENTPSTHRDNLSERSGTPQCLKDPTPLVSEIAAAEPFPTEALGPLKHAAMAIQDMVQCPAAMAAQSVLAVASLATQGLRDISLPHGAIVPLSLYFVTVAESGERKTTADALAIKPIRDFENNQVAPYRRDLLIYNQRFLVWDEMRKAIVKRASKPSDKQKANDELEELGPAPIPPILPWRITEDATMEGLIKQFSGSHPSQGLFSNEGGIFVGGHSMNNDNRLKTAGSLSKLWDGSPIDRVRGGDGSCRYQGRRISVHLMGQPVAMMPMLADPIMAGQGILARCLIAWPTSTIGTRLKIGHSAESERALEAFHDRISNLLQEPVPLATGEQNELAPPSLSLTPEARMALSSFASEVERAMGVGGKYERIRAFGSKAVEHAIRLAGVMAVFQAPNTMVVEANVVHDAIRLIKWYIGENLRLANAASISAEMAEAERLRQWLVGDARGNAKAWSEQLISARDALQKGPVRGDVRRVRKLFAILQENGWLVSVEGGGYVMGEHRKEAWRIVRPAQT